MRRLFLAVAMGFATVALSQQPQTLAPQPRIQSVFPIGAKLGTTVDVVVLGTDLDDATGLLFSHPGITGKYLPPPADPEPPKDPKKKDAPPAKMNKKAPLPTEAKFQIAVAASVPLGSYDVRVVNKWGVSNPRLFIVGDRPEINEKEPNNDVPEAQKIELGTTINGTISSAIDVDYSSFVGKAGQRVILSCATSSIDSRAKPMIEIYNGEGKRIGSNRNYDGADALADVLLPADGEYIVRLSEFAYIGGGPDYFYRLTIGVSPWIDAVFPPVVEAGKPAQVTVYGRNLPGGKPVAGVTIDGRPIESVAVTIPPTGEVGKLALRQRIEPVMGLLDGFEYRIGSPGNSSNAVPVFLTSLPVIVEKEASNDKMDTAEAVVTPCEVAGRIDRKYDRDWYSFTAKKGDVLMIELFADRIGSAMDTYLNVRSGDGKLDIANEGTLDDDPEILHPTSFFNRSGDPPAYKFTAAADGKYLIMVGSREANVSFGPRCAYRLRIAPPKPDYRAIVMARSRELPATTIAHSMGEVALDVFVQRHDGFNGPLAITVEGLPAGVVAVPASIGMGQKWGTLVLSGAGTLTDAAVEIKVKLTATIDGKPVSREARPASISWSLVGQQNVPLISRLDQSLIVATRADKSPFRIAVDLNAATVKVDGKDQKAILPLVVKPGEKISVPVKVTWQDAEARAGPVNVQAEATIANMQNAPVTVNNGQPLPIAKEKNDAPFVVDVKANAAPGTYTISLRGDTLVKFTKDPTGKDKKDITVSAFAPPFEVKVIPVSLGKITAQPVGNVKIGGTGEVTVRVERLFEFAGEFKVKLVFPKETKGVTAIEATIPAGQNEVKMIITADKDVKAGGISNIIVQAVAVWDAKYPTTHEAKFNLNISK